MTRARIAAAALLLIGTTAYIAADERIDFEINTRIRREERQHSQIMRTMHFLTDVYGPRLTGSPNHKAAAEWAAKQMTEWGLQNAHLEPWEFGHPGWLNERFSGFITAPVKDSLVGEVLAWTPSTNGPVAAQAVLIDPPHCVTPPTPGAAQAFGPPTAPAPAPKCPSQDELTAYLNDVRAKVNRRIVLVGAQTIVPVSLQAPATRVEEAQARLRFDLDAPPSQFPDQPKPEPGKLTALQIAEQVDAFLVGNGALVRVNDAGREHGQIRAFQNRAYDTSKAVPTVILRNEDYGRVARILADGTPVELEFNIVNRVYPEGHTTYNVVAEIPGTDKADEVVMLGGHLDSWHAATGATDNAIGAATMMEAARLIKAVGARPLRTIRVALWSGEEQGLLGSKAYVAEHFGTYESQKPQYAKLDAYFNVDSGTGRIRGASVFGPRGAGEILRDAFAPFEDLGVVGVSVTKSRRCGGTDSTSFNEAGLPGVGLGQDPIQYGWATWHTNLDTYERIIEDEVKRSATSIAAVVYHVASRPEMLPRFSAADMPSPAKVTTSQ